ncbi:uncharacterized protein FIBRA_02477 [Fibroporia radiculosa]|uniref:DUF6533 domain-containing protein n=1 Tax=Fibroporia radiculosa TaxID=599839 RepID=J4GMW6_9APHY|nr:uncharacterized protein FIBRA_02477 [Fibroporia radiculosa]CCM00445.1 predicted protein [Fibroporia radiculosa]
MSDAYPINQVYLHNYLHLAGIAIFYYDYALTFGDEYARIWRQPKSRASWLFCLNRYLTALGDIAVNVGNFYEFKTAKGCVFMQRHHHHVDNALLVVVCVLLCLRIYAVYRKDKRVLAFVLGTGITLAGLSIYAVTGQNEGISLSGGCHYAASRITYVVDKSYALSNSILIYRSYHSLSSAIRIAVAWESLFVYDVMIFSLTMYKTWKDRHLYAPLPGRNGILTLVFRDGAIYFAVMASVNLANTLTFYVRPVPMHVFPVADTAQFLQPLLRGVLSTFASSVSVTMMSRLMLNLHESASAHPSLATNPNDSQNSTTILFTSHMMDYEPGTHLETLPEVDIEEIPDDSPTVVPELFEMQDIDTPHRRNYDLDRIA